MRKILSLLAVLVLSCVFSFAQTKTITGTVVDANGTPVPFASVVVRGQTEGVTSDGEGRFILRNVAPGTVLVLSSQGFAAQELTIGADNSYTVTLTTTSATLQEVVVTSAFGIKRSERTTPYSAQVITSEQLTTIRQPNLNNALAGKVAGVQFRGQSPIALNREGFLRIRGGQSLGDRGPLYVVDGTIVNAFDVNPDDVESLNVLKGANATALFGARAANGAVVITTRKRGARDGIGIEVNQALTFDRVYILPKYQNRYAGGDGDFITFNWEPGMPEEWQAFDGKQHHDFTDDASWGPEMTGQEYIPWYAFIPGHSRSNRTTSLTPQPNNARDFWNTGVTNNTNIAFSQGGQGYQFRMSYTNQAVKGMLPNSSSNRHNLFAAISYDLGSHFTAAANITYNTQKILGDFNDGYANQSSGSFTQWFHRDIDMNIMRELRGLRTPIGTLASWNFRRNPNSFVSAGDPRQSVFGGNYWYNFYSYFDQINNQQRRDRLYGDVSLTYKLNNHFNVRATLRKNSGTTNFQNIVPSLLERSAVQSGLLASYSAGQLAGTIANPLTFSEYNYEGIATYNNTFGDFGVNVTAGINKLTFRSSVVQTNTNGGLNVADLYAISNSRFPPTITNPRTNYDVNSLFAAGDIEFRRFLSLTWALRNDWYSTLPVADNALLSPSIGAAFVFSELTQDAIPWLSFGKLYGSWGKKPLTLDPYALTLNYEVNQFQWGNNFLMTTPNSTPDEGLTGSLVTTYEAGIDMRFFRNRLGLNVLYYFEDNDGEPLNVAQSGTSGFTSKRINIARIQRKGIEVELNYKPVTGGAVDWNITKTFHYLLDNTVVRLAPGVPSFTLSGGAFGTRFARAFHIEGEQWGMLRGGGIARNEAGQPLITTNQFSGGLGWYTNDPTKNWGSIVPRVTGGLQNFVTFKNFTMGLTLDYQFGGQFFSLSEQWGTFSGLLEHTAGLNDKGNPVRSDVADGGGVRVTGVDAADGRTPVDVYIPAYDYYHQFYYVQVAEPFIHSLTFVKLREFSIGYNIPVRTLGRLGQTIRGANFSIIARNPWLIYRETDNFDPSEISFNHGEDGQFPGTRSLGFNLKLNF